MEAQKYNVSEKHVYYPQYDPIYQKEYGVLNPETLTFKDIEEHAIKHQNKDPKGTVKKLMDYLGKMASHPVFPVDFNNPDWKQYFRYMDHIKEHGDYDRYGHLKSVGVHGLPNRDEAWLMYLRAIGYQDRFPRYKIPKRLIPDNSMDKPIPQPEDVYEMLNFKYVSRKEFDRYYPMLKAEGLRPRDLNRYIQYLFFFGHFIGMAPEKEWVILNVGDIIQSKTGRWRIRITRPKVGNKKRIIPLETTISVSPVHKSIKNYLLKVRPKFAKKEEALFVDPRTGERWGIDALRRFLTKYGKRVYAPFYPYLMRHWCGTARLIDWDREGIDAFSRVMEWLGHADPKDTKIYCALSKLFDDNNGSWLSRALKQDWLGGLDGSPRDAQQKANKGVVVQNIRNKKKESPQARF